MRHRPSTRCRHPWHGVLGGALLVLFCFFRAAPAVPAAADQTSGSLAAAATAEASAMVPGLLTGLPDPP